MSSLKRIRYKIPTYKKTDKINQNILDYKCNQQHIFRLKALHSIYSLIANEVYDGQTKLNFDDFSFFVDGLTIHFDSSNGNQAEITGTELLPVGERVKIHIKLLRLLRFGKSLKNSVISARKCLI